MSNYEVPEPILNSPYEEPRQYWRIEEGESPEKMTGRRAAMYFYRDPKAKPDTHGGSNRGIAIELKVVNRIRERVKAWRDAGHPGVTRTTLELLQWWNRDGRETRLFFAQREAAETIIFLTEARADFRQGIEIARDDPSDDKKQQGYKGFLRYACKMATGSGKTTVMGMLAAWSILNKVNDRSDGRFSDWTSRDVREVLKSHLNYIVADTKTWEQSAAYYIDKHEAVDAFVKNAGLGFAIPYLHNGQMHDYMPDFILRLRTNEQHHLILEVKGYDLLEEVKAAAAERWVNAVNADGKYGHWRYRMIKKVTDVNIAIKQGV